MASDGDLVTAYLALGSNKGDREENLYRALEELSKFMRLEAVSPLYETANIGPPAPDYLNCVAEIKSSLQPDGLMDRCFDVEASLGRDRAAEMRWGARPMDIDILLYGDSELNTEKVIIPHPRMMHRRFVLEPLMNLAPNLLVPGFGATVSDAFGWPSTQEQKVDRVEWTRSIASLLE